MPASPSVREDAGVASERTPSWFAFTVGDDAFVIPSEWVEAVVDVDSVTELPDPPASVEGIVVSSERALPLVSLVPRRPTPASTSDTDARSTRRALLVSVDGIDILIRCDGVLGSSDAEGASLPREPRSISLGRLVQAARGSTEVSASLKRGAVASRQKPTAFVVVEGDDRFIALSGDRLHGIHRVADGVAEGVHLDAWLARGLDDARPERQLDFGDGLTLRTRSTMTIVGSDAATELPLPALLDAWGERLGVRALMVREGRIGLSLDPVDFIRHLRASRDPVGEPRI